MKKAVLPILLLLLVLVVALLFRNPVTNTQNISNNTTGSEAQSTTATDTTISCSGQPIPEQTEGPYYKADTPQTTTFYNGSIPGEKVTLTGYVLDTECKPIANAWIDFWQADGNGDYDNEGYTLRGHQYTDANGKYMLTTVIPGEYPGRTPHIHFKVQANENAPIITSQLYLPDKEANTTDAIFDDKLVMQITEGTNGKEASYTIVVNR